MNKCKVCENTGIKKVANGPDDVETTYCHCTVGKSYEFFDNDFSAWWKEQVKSLANAKKV